MDGETFEKLYKTYYMRVYSYAMTLCGNSHNAEDLTQEAFYRAFTTHSTFRNDSDEMTWICAIVKNLYTDLLRKNAKTAELPPDTDIDSGINIERSAADADMSFRIHMILHGLEEPYREVFELRVFGDLSFAQIATVFGKTEGWARVTYHRAKLQIQERMENQK